MCPDPSPTSLVESRSGGLGHKNAKTARRFLPGVPNPIVAPLRRDTALAYTDRYPIPSDGKSAPFVNIQTDSNLRNYPENSVRISREKIVPRYKDVRRR